MITGESRPIKKLAGDLVIGGTMNQQGMLIIKATSVGSKTYLSQIIKLVQEAQVEKAPIQVLADKISSVFVPIVLGLALITFTVWFIIAQTTEVNNPEGRSPFLYALLFAISVVVISCPCALGLATPTAVMVGTGIGAENGILIKSGKHLETAFKVTAVVFDKTGTITEGKPRVTKTILYEKKRRNFLQLCSCSRDRQ